MQPVLRGIPGMFVVSAAFEATFHKRPNGASRVNVSVGGFISQELGDAVPSHDVKLEKLPALQRAGTR